MVQDLVHNLCESLVENIDGVAGIGKKTPPTPITYLTQWKIVGNSEVHTDEYLTSWKVSGNSVVDNNTILSCGDLGQDGNYHVKISNGVTIFDIPLTEPLRKVNDISDTIEFANGVVTLTRNLAKSTDLGKKNWGTWRVQDADDYCMAINVNVLNPAIKIVGTEEATALCSLYNTITAYQAHTGTKEGIGISGSLIRVYDKNYNQRSSVTDFKQHIKDIELIYWIEPITEVIEVSPFPVSPTDTYTSANVVPYSAFEHTENKEIWSCGEYNPIDGKWHILVQPLGGSIADIALTEPLRKVNNVADSIEFPSSEEGKALVTRNLSSILIGNVDLTYGSSSTTNVKRIQLIGVTAKPTSHNEVANILCSVFEARSANSTYTCNKGISVDGQGRMHIYDPDHVTTSVFDDFKVAYADTEIIYELATPTTELVDAPQIEEAESYSCVISQGGKAVEWTEFVANPT